MIFLLLKRLIHFSARRARQSAMNVIFLGEEREKHFEAAFEACAYSLAGYPSKHRFSTHHKNAGPICLHEEGKPPRAAKEHQGTLALLEPAKEVLAAARVQKPLLAAAAAA